MKIRNWVAGIIGAGLLAAGLPAAPAQAAVTALPASVTSCSGVWVVVARGDSDVSVRCAKSYSTGLVALKSAGFAVGSETSSYGEYVTRVNGYPLTLDTTYTNYWGYWHASPNADGTWSSWTSYAVGASASTPVKGSVEGWYYGSYSASATFTQPPLGYSKKGAVKVTGVKKVGKRLTAKVGTWTPTPTLSYRWYRNGKKIAKATHSTYKLKKADRGKKIRVKVTATGTNLQTVVVSSSATRKIRHR
jgi:hypothetical protein